MNILGKLFDVGKALGQLQPHDKTQTDKQQSNQATNALGANNDIFEKHSGATIGTQVLFHSISSKFESSVQFTQDFTQSIKAIEEKNNQLFDFEKVAETVLNFIGKTIRGARQDGADNDKVSSLLDHARKGVQQGIDEASEELKGLGLFDADIEEGIAKSKSLIDEGIDALQEELIPTKTNPMADHLQRQIDYAGGFMSTSEASSHLEITTADGDKVSIAFSAYREMVQTEFASVSNANNGDSRAAYGYQFESYSEINFSYTVEGELDEQEQEAIAMLIKDINSVQQEFFAGDVEKAYEKALELGLDSEEITSVAMNLAKVETTVVAQAYRDVASLSEKPEDAEKANELADVTRPIADYVDRFNQLQEVANRILESNRQYFKELMEQVIKADTAEPAVFADKLARFQAFHNGMFNTSQSNE